MAEHLKFNSQGVWEPLLAPLLPWETQKNQRVKVCHLHRTMISANPFLVV